MLILSLTATRWQRDGNQNFHHTPQIRRRRTPVHHCLPQRLWINCKNAQVMIPFVNSDINNAWNHQPVYLPSIKRGWKNPWKFYDFFKLNRVFQMGKSSKYTINFYKLWISSILNGWVSHPSIWAFPKMVVPQNHPFFPTCQVRVGRFYQSCSPHPPPPPSPPPTPPPPPPPPLPPPPVSPRPCLHQLPRPLPPCQLVANLFANFRAQWALLDLNCRLPIWVGTARPQLPGSERSGHRWTSTAGFRAQWAPLDLNLGPSELSGHRLRSIVGTAGPQPGTFRAQWERWTSTAR